MSTNTPSKISQDATWEWEFSQTQLGPRGAADLPSVTSHGITVTALAVPSPVCTVLGTAGTTTWSYKVSSVAGGLETLPVACSTTTGPAALGALNYVRISWAAVSGATAYRVYRSVGGVYNRLAEVYTTLYDDTGAVTPDSAVHPQTTDQTGLISGTSVGTVTHALTADAADTATLAVSATSADTATTAVSLVDTAGAGSIFAWDSGADAWVTNEKVEAIGGFTGALTGNADTATTLTGVLSKTLGGAGDVTGILKANGSGTVSAAAGADLLSTHGVQTANTVLAGPTTGAAANPTFRALVAADLPFSADILIPAVIYATEGHEANVYWDGAIRADVPISSLRINVVCDVGTQQTDRWTYTPAGAAVGDHTFTVTVSYNEAQLATKTCTLRVARTGHGTGVTRQLITMGDSTTAGGQYLAELVNLCAAETLAVTTVGSLSDTVADADGDNRTVKNDGISGWTINSFYTDAGSPFVTGGVFDFGAYLTAQSITLNADDWVLINLGINDVFSYTTDAALTTKMAAMKTQIDGMIADIHDTLATARIGLCLTIPPSRTQEAMGANYDSGQTLGRYKRNRDLWCEYLLTNYDGRESEDIYIVPIGLGLDTLNNMSTTVANINERNGSPVVRQSNGVHPADAGYWQMADGIYAFLKGNESSDVTNPAPATPTYTTALQTWTNPDTAEVVATISRTGAFTGGLGAPLTVTGTSETDGPTLSAELIETANWSVTGGAGEDHQWTADAFTTITHAVDGTNHTATLLNSLAAVNATRYQVAYTVTGRTVGSFTIAFGGQTSASITATGAWGPTSTTTGSVVITPTADFNGTIVVSIKKITESSSAIVILKDSGGNARLEMRADDAFYNTFIGLKSGTYLTTGSSNTGLGYSSLRSVTTGEQNTGVGNSTLYANTTGYNNTAIGRSALTANKTGSSNTAIGVAALSANTSGTNNVAIGSDSLLGNLTGVYNVAVGNFTAKNTTASENTALGVSALYTNVAGAQNTAIGRSALAAGSGSNNLGIGYAAGRYETGSNKIFIDTVDRTNEAGGRSSSLIYGVTSATVASQTLTVNGRFIPGLAAPATQTSAGTIGEIRADTGYLYVCTVTGVDTAAHWKRVALDDTSW
jgi:lysophospholipase L1-like esterase